MLLHCEESIWYCLSRGLEKTLKDAVDLFEVDLLAAA